MKKKSFLLLLLFFVRPLFAETLSEQYAKYGDVFIVNLDSAPFPHPARAKGHTYGTNVYSAEKNYSTNSIGIFVPKGFQPKDRTDFVVHFYGWRHHIETTLAEYKLIEQFTASGRNAILIVPTGPYDAADSFAGKMEDTNGFKNLMDDIVSTLQKRGVIQSSNIGNIILSGHSGGYRAEAYIVLRGGLSASVKEVYLFDALYADTEKYMGWFNKYPKRRLIDIYTLHGGTKEMTEKLMDAMKMVQPATQFVAKKEANITPEDLRDNRLIFIYSDFPHDETVYGKSQFREFLETSCLAPIASDASKPAGK